VKKEYTTYFELTAVLFTGAAKFLFFDVLHRQFWFIMTASLFWLGYLIFNSITNKQRVLHWGFQRKGLKESIRLIFPIALIAVTLFVTYGILSDKLILSWHIVPSLLLYPLWGIAQQYLILGLIAGNLQDIKSLKIFKPLIILITAILFCLVHFPNYKLMGGTFILAVVYTIVYMRYRNLWALGVIHGWLGSFFYYFVLGKDAWLTFIKSI